MLVENSVQTSNVFVSAVDVVDHAAAVLDVVVAVVLIVIVHMLWSDCCRCCSMEQSGGSYIF